MNKFQARDALATNNSVSQELVAKQLQGKRWNSHQGLKGTPNEEADYTP
jgi:hypothetical protein